MFGLVSGVFPFHETCVVDLYKMYPHSDSCEVMHAACVWECEFWFVQGTCSLQSLRGHVCMCLFVCSYAKVYAYCDCCEAMYACVGVCVGAWTRCILTLIGVKGCTRVLVCALLYTRGVLTVIAARRYVRALVCAACLCV